jgi:hypothetical protein
MEPRIRICLRWTFYVAHSAIDGFMLRISSAAKILTPVLITMYIVQCTVTLVAVYCEGANSRPASYWRFTFSWPPSHSKFACGRLSLCYLLLSRIYVEIWIWKIAGQLGFHALAARTVQNQWCISKKSLKLPEMMKSAKNIIIRVCNNTLLKKLISLVRKCFIFNDKPFSVPVELFNIERGCNSRTEIWERET